MRKSSTSSLNIGSVLSNRNTLSDNAFLTIAQLFCPPCRIAADGAGAECVGAWRAALAMSAASPVHRSRDRDLACCAETALSLPHIRLGELVSLTRWHGSSSELTLLPHVHHQMDLHALHGRGGGVPGLGPPSKRQSSVAVMCLLAESSSVIGLTGPCISLGNGYDKKNIYTYIYIS
jgi:hypothetical protein